MYIYHENLKSKPVLWLWQLRDIGIIGISLLVSVLAQLGLLLPTVATALYGFMTIKFEVEGMLLLKLIRIEYDNDKLVEEIIAELVKKHTAKTNTEVNNNKNK